MHQDASANRFLDFESLPTFQAADGRLTVTSLQVAENFGKRHSDILRAIRNMSCGDEFKAANFELISYRDTAGRSQQLVNMSREGFTLLAMGFTGKRFLRLKLSFIESVSKAKSASVLDTLYTEPLVSDKEFRQGISLRDKLMLQEQSRSITEKLKTESASFVRRNLYFQLRQVNDALGIPTESAANLLGVDAIFPVQETEF